jgi:ABC-type Zn uptake system ZnuABC Zn-binding protein ZnuA
MKKKFTIFALILSLIFVLSACSSPESDSDSLKIVVSTSIIADVAEQISGGIFEMVVLLPSGVDPHGYQPAPQDIAAITDAEIVLINGYGLEEFLNSILDENLLNKKIITVSEGVEINSGDPHVWMDPANVMIWVENIADAFVVLKPDMENEIRANAESYIQQLQELDAWIMGSVGQIPEQNRVLVSDHLSLGYFANRYGFEQAGTITQSASSLAEPSASELADLIDLIREMNLPAIFIGQESNPDLAERLTTDLEIKMIELFIGSLSPEDGPAGSYLDMMRFNVEAITSALK